MTYRSWLKAPILTLAMAGLAPVGTGLARGARGPEARNQAGPVVLPLDQALELTRTTGKPTVAVSSGFLGELLRSSSARELAASVQFAPVPEQASADRTRWLGPAATREVRVYQRGVKGAELVAHLNDGEDAPHTVAWLKTLRRPAAREVKTDESVSRAGHWHQPSAAVPSPQAVFPPAPPAPMRPVAPAPQPLVPLAVAPTPTAAVVAQPAAAPLVLQTPAPSILLQQTAPTIYIAPPAQPANIQILAPPPAAPSVSVLQPAAAVQAPPQLFLAPAAAPAAPAVAPAPSAMAVPAYAAAPSYAVAPVAAAAPSYAVAPVAAAAPATATLTAVQPGLLGQLIGSLGERMAKHKQPKLKLTTTTPAAAPALVPAAAPALVPAAVQPPAAAAPQYYCVPTAPAQPVAPPASPPALPSPQE